jgi:hypothetical protein
LSSSSSVQGCGRALCPSLHLLQRTLQQSRGPEPLAQQQEVVRSMNSEGRSSARQPLRSDTQPQFSDEYVQPPFGCRRSRSILRSLLVSVWVIAFTIAASRGALVCGQSSKCFAPQARASRAAHGAPDHQRRASPRAPASDAAQPTLWQPALQSNLTLQSDGATAVGEPGSLLLVQERRCAVLGFRRLTHHQRFAAPVFRDCHLQRA